MSETRNAPEISVIDDARWQEARRRFEVIQELAQCAERTTADVLAAADALNCSQSQIYLLLVRYLEDPKLTSLLPHPRGRRRGVSQCSGTVDRLIHEAIDSVYLTRQKAKVSDLEIEVRRRCFERGLLAPSRKAITARVRLRPKLEVLARREGGKTARAKLAPVLGHLEAERPLSLVQIDHTLVDV